MAVHIHQLVDKNGRIDYNAMLEYVFTCPFSLFAEQAPNPFLVGRELYDGELKQKQTNSFSATSTMMFEAAKVLQEEPPPGISARDLGLSIGSEKKDSPPPKEDRSAISRAIFMLRKSPYAKESNPNIITIGRSIENDIVISDYVISKMHAQIVLFKKMFFIVDLNSTNGTMINHRAIAPNVKVQIGPNSAITLGRIGFVLTSPMTLYKGLRKENL